MCVQVVDIRRILKNIQTYFLQYQRSGRSGGNISVTTNFDIK